VSQVVRHVTEAGTTVPRDFENAKIEDISDCRAMARQRMVKRMLRQDSAHRGAISLLHANSLSVEVPA